MVHEINDRVLIEGQSCTIRFIGEIHRWPGLRAYGVEWDDPKRGKNSGTVDDREYFKTVVPNSGSFLKGTKWSVLVDSGVSFHQALQEKYGKTHTDRRDIYLGTKKVESFGFEKLIIEEHNLGNLQGICLDHCKVSHLEVKSEQLTGQYSSILEIDLSYNLLTDFREICEFLKCFPSMKFLDLSNNYLTKGWENLGFYDFSNIKVLSLSNCRLNLNHLKQILQIFPSIEILNASKNCLQDIESIETLLPSSIRELVLSENSIRYLPVSLPLWDVQTLNISHNNIEVTSNVSSDILKSLDISYNFILDWRTIDQLNTDFPELNSLRVNGNPFFENGEDHLAQFYLVIARFNHLSIFNGSLLSKNELEEAKLFFISQVSQGLVHYNKNSQLWYRLYHQYIPKNSIQTIEDSWLGSQILRIKVQQERMQKIITLTILSTYTVRNLKRIICNELETDIFEITLFYFIAPSVLQEVDQDFIPLSDLNLTNGDFVYIKRKE